MIDSDLRFLLFVPREYGGFNTGVINAPPDSITAAKLNDSCLRQYRLARKIGSIGITQILTDALGIQDRDDIVTRCSYCHSVEDLHPLATALISGRVNADKVFGYSRDEEIWVEYEVGEGELTPIRE